MRRTWPYALAAILLLTLGTLVARTLGFPSRQIDVEPIAGIDLDLDAALERFRAALRVPTVSSDDPAEVDDGPGEDPAKAMARFRELLPELFPRVHAELELEVVGGGALLYRWAGRDPDAAPALLLGHYDVVPIEPGTEERWTHPPFAATVAGGYVWGRGSLDDKINVLGLLEAAEHLLARKFQPARTVYFAFGHDEEIGGEDGAVKMAARLAERGVEAEFVVDEGMVVTRGILPGIEAPMAAIGIAEKGYVTLELVAASAGGHSSMPAAPTAIGRLARALAALEDTPLPARLDGPAREMFAYLAPEFPLAQRLPLANLWLFGPAVTRQLSANAGLNAVLRTTTAPTVVSAGVKDNVLPTEARALVNFRIHPLDTVEGVVAVVREIVDDPAVTVRIHGEFATEPSPVSPVDGSGFRLLQRTIGEIFPEAVVAPALVLGATDSRHYTGLSRQVYRFTPIVLEAGDLGRFHGIDERLGVDAYGTAIRFYVRLLENLDGL